MGRSRQKEQRRAAILEAGLRVFVRRGYAAARVQDIAKEAGMSTGLLFHYFTSKEELYLELIRMGTAAPVDLVSEGAQQAPDTFFLAAVQLILRGLREDSMTAQMFVLMTQAEYSEGTPLSAREEMQRLDIIAASAPLIERGQKQGLFRQGDPLALSMTFWMAVSGVAQYKAMRHDAPPPEASWLMSILCNQEARGDCPTNETREA